MSVPVGRVGRGRTWLQSLEGSLSAGRRHATGAAAQANLPSWRLPGRGRHSWARPCACGFGLDGVSGGAAAGCAAGGSYIGTTTFSSVFIPSFLINLLLDICFLV